MPESHFLSSPNKKSIRDLWNSPMLKFLSHEFSSRLLYFGLPSPNAEDVIEWIEYIDEIIAFQCRDYPKPSHPSQSDQAIQTLESKLRGLHRMNQINNYVIYDGYIEEVVVNGRDNSHLSLSLNSFITLFNLDFCNEITSPQKFFNEKLNREDEVFKLEIIRKIIEIQLTNNSHPSRFVFFLTVGSNLFKQEAARFINAYRGNSRFGDYIESLSSLSKKERNIRLLRAYIIITLSDIFRTHKYIPEFLPVARYVSEDGYSLIQFAVIGTFQNTMGGSAVENQDIVQLLKSCFVSPHLGDRIVNLDDQKFAEESVETDPVSFFQKSKTFNEYWRA